MPSNTPLLTIAVPTYNRSRALSRLLDSLAPQVKDEPRIEVLISDNASPDDTPAVLEGYRRNNLIFRAIRNEINLGPDGNIAQCFAEATGKYIWIVGDDDAVIPGAIAIIIDLLTEDEYDIVHLRGRELHQDMQLKALSRLPQMEIIHNARIFTLRTHVYLTFITSNIINRQRVLSLPHQPFSSLIGSSLVQLGWTYTALLHFRKGVFVQDPLMAAGADDRGGYAPYTVFGTNLKQITETWLGQPALVRIVLNGTLQKFFPALVLRTKLQVGSFVAEKPDALLSSLFANNARYYFFLYPMLKLPSYLGRLWLFLCRVVNRVDKAFGDNMLR